MFSSDFDCIELRHGGYWEDVATDEGVERVFNAIVRGFFGEVKISKEAIVV